MPKATGIYSYRNIWKVAYPILISLVMEQMIGFGFSIGAQIIIGRRNGEGRFTETGKVFFLAVSGTGSTKTAFRLELVSLFICSLWYMRSGRWKNRRI